MSTDELKEAAHELQCEVSATDFWRDDQVPVVVGLAELLRLIAEDLDLDDNHDGFDSSVYTHARKISREILQAADEWRDS